MRALALDPGERWVGVAVSDSDGRMAVPLIALDRRAESDGGVARIRAALGPEGAEVVVIGLPLDPEGEEDAQAARLRMYGERVAGALGLPAVIQNERYSNPISEFPSPSETQTRGRDTSVRRHRERRVARHAQAAAAILQWWLDARREQAISGPLPPGRRAGDPGRA